MAPNSGSPSAGLLVNPLDDFMTFYHTLFIVH